MPRSDAKLKNLSEDLQAEMWRLRSTPVGEDGEAASAADGSAWSQEQVREWLEDVHGVKCSAGAFSAWQRWYGLNSRMTGAKTLASQVMEELKKSKPDLSAEEIMEYGQLVFAMEALEEKDSKGFLGFANLAEKQAARRMEQEKMSLAAKSKIEAGLEALFEQIQGNAKAEKIFRQLQKEVAAA